MNLHKCSLLTEPTPLGQFSHRIAMSVWMSVCLPPLKKVGCPTFFEIQNPWGKVIERSGLRFEHFCFEVV